MQLRSGEELAERDANDEHVIAAVEYLLNYAFDQRASDIHLEPRDSDGLVRFRIDGILHDIEKVPLSVHGAITSRVKVLARMDIAERRRPQDGRIKTMRGDREVELRVSSLATAFGEKIVVRVFDPTVLMTDLHQLGFGVRDREIFERWITSPSGLILVTGPTGSGKTTTLYSTLRYLAGPEVNIQTVEDPIEVVDPRFCQMQVQRQIDVTFATALRSILRQDPDIIMVGEIRDGETAQMAVQAALTGHLVLLDGPHARRRRRRHAPRRARRRALPALERAARRGGAAPRALHLPALQRRGLPRPPTQVTALGLKVPIERREQLRVRWGEGCIECRYTGLYGRIGVFEMLDVGRRVRALVNEGRDAQRDRPRRARRGHGDAARGRDPQARGRRHHLRGGGPRHGGRAVSREQVGRSSGSSCAPAGAWSPLETLRGGPRAARARQGGRRDQARARAPGRAAAGFEPDGAGAGSLDACVQALAAVEEPALFALLDAQSVLGDARRPCAGCATGSPSSGKRKQMVVLVGPAPRRARRARARGRPRRARRCRRPTSCAASSRRWSRPPAASAPTREVLDACVRAALGLTAGEAVRAFRKAWLAAGRLGERRDRRALVREKRQALHRTPALTFHEASEASPTSAASAS